MRKLVVKFLKIIGVISAIYIIAIPIYINNYSHKYIHSKQLDISYYEYAIVLGAGVDKHGVPQDMLEDRLIVAAELYKKDKVSKILITGDNSKSHNFETDVMRKYLVEELSVPSEDIVADEIGKRTYDSCARVSEDINIHSAVIITQQFHLDRAVFLCNQLGVPLFGLPADIRGSYNHAEYFRLREFLAKHKAFIDIYFYAPAYTKLSEEGFIGE